MNHITSLAITIIIFIIIITANGCSEKNQPLTIATAANAQFALAELVELYEARTGQPGRLVVGASGKLTAQIRAGAPYDVLISADMRYPQALADEGLTTAAPLLYARGRLVLWSMMDSGFCWVSRLADPAIRHIALADPKTAPYGQAGMACLTHFGLADRLKPKLVFGASISQTSQFVYGRSAEVGFTALSSVLHFGQGYWRELPPESYPPILQGAVAIKGRPLTPQAEAFLRFLQSPDAQQVLTQYGYTEAATREAALGSVK